MAGYCSLAPDDTGSVIGSWQQCRRLSGDHCRHSPSYLVNSSWGPGEESADSKEADSHRSFFGAPRPPLSHPLTGGPAVFGPYRPASWAQYMAHYS